MRHNLSRAKLFAATPIAFLFGLGLASSLEWTAGTRASPVVAQEAPPAESQLRRAQNLSDAFVTIADAVTPSVVRIQAERPASGERRSVPPGLRDFLEPEAPHDRPSQPTIAGGSGLIVDADGYIVTNNHVIAGARRIWVTLSDKRTMEAEVVGRDPTTDIAVLRIDAGGLATAPFGDSDRIRVGEWVVAIGNPGFNDVSTLDFTVTSGIVSAKGRPLNIIHQELALERNPAASYAIEDFIQTDAVINPGNSGGPLVDLDGRVIGLNTAIASGTGFYQGYGFAIPANLVRRVARDLIRHGHVRRALLGIMIKNVTAEDAEVYGLSEISGVLIEDFAGDAPARSAGLKRHDVIVAVDGTPVERVGQLQRVIAKQPPGGSVDVEVLRFGERHRFRVALMEAPIPRTVQPASSGRSADGPDHLGIRIAELTSSRARQLGFRDAGGAVIVGVAPMSPAHRKGVQQGARIVSINQRPVASADEAEKLLGSMGSGQIISLLLQERDGRTRITNVRVP